jgi:hypothetical protein
MSTSTSAQQSLDIERLAKSILAALPRLPVERALPGSDAVRGPTVPLPMPKGPIAGVLARALPKAAPVLRGLGWVGAAVDAVRLAAPLVKGLLKHFRSPEPQPQKAPVKPGPSPRPATETTRASSPLWADPKTYERLTALAQLGGLSEVQAARAKEAAALTPSEIAERYEAGARRVLTEGLAKAKEAWDRTGDIREAIKAVAPCFRDAKLDPRDIAVLLDKKSPTWEKAVAAGHVLQEASKVGSCVIEKLDEKEKGRLQSPSPQTAPTSSQPSTTVPSASQAADSPRVGALVAIIDGGYRQLLDRALANALSQAQEIVPGADAMLSAVKTATADAARDLEAWLAAPGLGWDRLATAGAATRITEAAPSVTAPDAPFASLGRLVPEPLAGGERSR